MKYTTTLAALSLAVISLVSPARADDSKCKKVNGHATWTLIPAPFDPNGRILGPSTGDLKAAISAIILSLSANPSTGVITADSLEVWVLGATDTFVANGHATFTPIPGQPIGTVQDNLTLTLTGGTGEFAGATGTINVTGVGHNIFGPGSGPGLGYFDVDYNGTVCKAK